MHSDSNAVEPNNSQIVPLPLFKISVGDILVADNQFTICAISTWFPLYLIPVVFKDPVVNTLQETKHKGVLGIRLGV